MDACEDLAPRRLTVDAGNSSAKLVLWSAEEPLERAQLSWSETTGAELALFLRRHSAVEAAALSSVAGEERTTLLVQILTEHVPCVRVAPDSGLANRTREPWTVGRDRLYAARAALACVGGPVLVVDAGTALTVDAATREADGAWVFLGGAIAPGPALLARALDRDGGGTADLPRVEPMPYVPPSTVPGEVPGCVPPSTADAPRVPALGRTTPEAMQSGIAVGFRGAARELVERIAAEAGSGFDAAPVVLCGGARAFLEGAFARETRVEPDLVARGLLLALEEQA